MPYTSREVERAYIEIKKNYDFTYDLKSEQIQALTNLVNKAHSFVVLPTGYGKTDIFILTPLLLDVLEPGKRHCALCIIPISGLMVDINIKFKARKVPITIVTKLRDLECKNYIKEGKYSVILTSPECVQDMEQWRSLFLDSEDFRKCLCLIAIDEAHVIIEW